MIILPKTRLNPRLRAWPDESLKGKAEREVRGHIYRGRTCKTRVKTCYMPKMVKWKNGPQTKTQKINHSNWSEVIRRINLPQLQTSRIRRIGLQEHHMHLKEPAKSSNQDLNSVSSPGFCQQWWFREWKPLKCAEPEVLHCIPSVYTKMCHARGPL